MVWLTLQQQQQQQQSSSRSAKQEVSTTSRHAQPKCKPRNLGDSTHSTHSRKQQDRAQPETHSTTQQRQHAGRAPWQLQGQWPQMGGLPRLRGCEWQAGDLEMPMLLLRVLPVQGLGQARTFKAPQQLVSLKNAVWFCTWELFKNERFWML